MLEDNFTLTLRDFKEVADFSAAAATAKTSFINKIIKFVVYLIILDIKLYKKMLSPSSHNLKPSDIGCETFYQKQLALYSLDEVKEHSLDNFMNKSV